MSLTPRGFLAPRVRIAGLFSAAGAIACACTLAGFAGRLWWRFELCSHFRLQYFAGLALLSVLMALMKSKRVALAFAAFAAVNLVLLVPMLVGGVDREREGGAPLRVMLANVHTSNSSHELVVNAVMDSRADVVVLEEVDVRWLAALGALAPRYSLVVAEPRDDNFGIAVFSRLPVRHSSIVYIGPADVPSCIVGVTVDGREVDIVATHPLPPANAGCADARNAQIAELPAMIGELGAPVVLIGDLNMTQWSPYFGDLLKASGLKDTMKGFGVQTTWPTYMIPMSIPLDHCLVSSNIVVAGRSVGPHTGSDHYPLIVDLVL